MTDNTQELDDILFDLCDLSYASFTTQEEADRVADQLDYDRAKAKQALIDWHNKQIKEALDRLKEPTLEDVRLMQPDTSAEEQLREEILTEFKQVHKLAPADYTENCTNVVMSIIRTEKLKLLAEVRERVIGKDEPGVTNIMIAAEHAEQRNVLTKLEAEL